MDRLPPTPRRGYAIGLIVSSSVVISFGGVIVRNIDAADPWQINFYRSASLAAALTVIMLLRYGGATPRYIQSIGAAGIAGAMLLAAAGIAFMQALTHTTVANTLFILSAIPFFAAGLARLFLNERLQRITLATMVAAAVGISIMIGDGIGAGSIYGNAMALATALSFASFAVIVRRQRQVDMVPAVWLSGLIITAVAFLVRIGDIAISLHDIALCIVWGAVLSGFANSMFVIAARHLAAAEVTLFMLLEFTLGPLWVWLFIGEQPSRWALMGGAVVIVSVAIRALAQLRRPSE
ncbi:MAG: DMT family transporter [Gammaproteobacteria bacterium]|nr:DMT family transporter [Gammaproteobacteria bacterium]MDH3466945.1 DMT family transporter [Gammaproteobacteria bacterium]